LDFQRRLDYLEEHEMAERDLRRFRRSPVKVGEKIWLEDDGPRQGEWEVMAVEEDKITLRCPIAHRLEFIPPLYEISGEEAEE
jgi:hypothetical protein